MSHMPTNDNEWQLYRTLQNANLIQYYSAFINQGGDDLNQLCEAGEDEFLEMMALVGMASKPLHVRRLQKALHDWYINSNTSNYQNTSSTPIKRLDDLNEDEISNQNNHSTEISDVRILTSEQISVIKKSVNNLVENLPHYAPRPLNSKKSSEKKIEELLNMDEHDPGRTELLQKYACIYSNLDRRRQYKPINIYEACINEAACQLVVHRPALVTRKDELLSLARQVLIACTTELSTLLPEFLKIFSEKKELTHDEDEKSGSDSSMECNK